MKGRRATRAAVVPAKISVPRLAESYARVRLFRAFDAACHKKLVWISAPAGAGKTSVVATYLAARRRPALWYNVDARDSDAANLFHYLTLAAGLDSRRRQLKLPAFTAENQQGVAAFARGFFEALYAQRPSPSVIVLDDYQDARSDLFDEVVREAIAELPKGISFVIVSRAEPPPHFLRLAASGDIALIGANDLRLSARDTEGLVRVHRPDFRGPQLKRALPRIIELANGWAAALTLLLQDRSIEDFDPRSVGQFSERLFDYFAAEVFDKASPSHCEFLLKTSVVPTLTPGLASRLADAADAGRTLADLDRRSFLIQRLGDSGTYRYHPLLRGFLLRRAKATFGASAVRELHHTAANALAMAGQVDEAIEQFEAAEDVTERPRLLLQLAPAYIAAGRSRTIAAWIARLPADLVEENGWLLYWKAVSCIGYWAARPNELLERAYRLFEKGRVGDGLHLTCAVAMQAIVQEGTGFDRLDVWMERFESLERDGPACPEPFLPMAATGMLMASAFRRLDSADSRKWVERAMELSAHSNDLAHRVVTGGFLAMYFAMYETPARASALLAILRQLAHEASHSVLPMITFMNSDALCRWLQGDNDATLAQLREALALSGRTGVFMWNDFLYGLGVGAALYEEDAQAVREFLEPMAEIAQERGGWPAGVYYFHACFEALHRGDTGNALHYAELARANADKNGPPFGRTIAHLLSAQVLWQVGRVDEANESLAIAARLADQGGCAVIRYGCLLVESDLAWDRDRDRALASLRAGLAFGRERGYHNVFGLAKRTLERCAIRALEHDIEASHISATIRKHRLKPDQLPPRLEAWPWRYRFRVLGSFEMSREADGSREARLRRGDTIGKPRGMPRRLLEAILALGARGVRDIRIIDALWPDAEGDAGRRALDTTLHRLRRQMGDSEFIQLTDGRFYLDGRTCWLDVWAFDDMAVQIEGEVARNAASESLVNLARQLLRIYRGPLLGDDEGAGSWVSAPRDGLAGKFRRLAHLFGPALERAGHPQEASALLARLDQPQGSRF
jgi:LuxR family transcriptional regulator, maltose regulon positive regulatory protein